MADENSPAHSVGESNQPEIKTDSSFETSMDTSMSDDPPNLNETSEMESTLVSKPKSTIMELVDDYHERVFRYAFRLSGNQTDAEDLTQQTFLIAQEKLTQLRDQTKAASWLLAICRSCFLRAIRKKKPTPETTLQVSVHSVPQKVSSIEKLEQLSIQETLDNLPEDYRVILLMFYFEDLSYKEIAEKLRIKIGTVMSRLSRAKAAMRERHSS